MNVLTVTGNLGSDSRVNTVAGTSVCNFSVAMTSGYGDKKQTNWLDCALWGKQAESSLPSYLLKGQQVSVSGELGTREHDGKTYLTLRVNQITLCGRRDGNAAPQPAPQPAATTQPAPSSGGMAMDDGVPFAPVSKYAM